MIRALPITLLVLVAGASGAAAQHKIARPLLPNGGMWQSIPYSVADAKPDTPRNAERASPARVVAKATMPARLEAQPTARKPVPAAAVPPQPPAETAAARTKELSRRIGILSPGAKLDEPINDPDNPAWRRRAADRPGVEGRDFSVPIDESGKAGFVARGYRQEPTWSNPNGNTGATVSLRQRF
jgi:hypothetical protein